MPILLQTIFEIALAKNRDVLCIVFGDPRLDPPYYDGMMCEQNDEIIRQPDWETHSSRQTIVAWLDANHVGYSKTVFPQPGWVIEEGYCGAIYLDVPFDESNPVYKKLADFLETPEQTPRLPGMTFWVIRPSDAQKYMALSPEVGN